MFKKLSRNRAITGNAHSTVDVGSSPCRMFEPILPLHETTLIFIKSHNISNRCRLSCFAPINGCQSNLFLSDSIKETWVWHFCIEPPCLYAVFLTILAYMVKYPIHGKWVSFFYPFLSSFFTAQNT